MPSIFLSQIFSALAAGFPNEGNALLQPLQDYVDRRAIPITGKRTTVCLAKLGNDAGIIGAALLGELE